MHVLAGQQVDRALPVGAEYDHDTAHADTAAFGRAGKVVELNVFKKSFPTFDEDLLPFPIDHDDASTDLAASMLEEVRQARFREARRLKRVETLELEIRLARAQNEALRAALEAATDPTGRAAVETADEGAAVPDPTPRSAPSEGAAERVPAPTLGRFLVRLLRSRR